MFGHTQGLYSGPENIICRLVRGRAHVPVSDHIEGQTLQQQCAHLSTADNLQSAALVADAGSEWESNQRADVRGAAMRSISSRKLRESGPRSAQPAQREKKKGTEAQRDTETQSKTYNSAESSSLRTRRRRSIARTEGWCQSSVMSSALACSTCAFESRTTRPVSLESDEKLDWLAFGSSWCVDFERRSARRPSLRLNCQPLRRRGVPLLVTGVVPLRRFVSWSSSDNRGWSRSLRLASCCCQSSCFSLRRTEVPFVVLSDMYPASSMSRSSASRMVRTLLTMFKYTTGFHAARSSSNDRGAYRS